ncbi:NAD(P)-binding protein [Aspergillus heteromorphus CBS 117.55]|uniref:NAD(P)-binding protein n=1 Tax=Aspergillus heteromorphus CBS 117.55 TaxID=1448321 RepID=A0A317WUD3_9EURO|nr:NAD(P)-binding protein [Aspergillus heteromorphus CBS 117.55]PWY89949.1 NAD(P)-binding protein [Aspergillus heteromorphus CBS 117.55]
MAPSFLSSLFDLFQVTRGLNNTFLTDQHVPSANLTGKWIIITGSNNGVGFEAAKSFAAWGANLILACREPPAWELHPTAAVEECKALASTQGHASTIEWWEIDMADLNSVEAFCRRWLDSDRALDILCNNAGVASTSKTRMTKDGFQLVHQVNFLSHVLLTLRLLPSLARNAEPRIICTTSSVHHCGVLDLEHFNGGAEMKGGDYGNNKLYFQMWVAEMQARFLNHPEYLHITINGVNPGCVASGIWNDVNKAHNTADRILAFLLRYIAITPQQGSLAITHAATSPELAPDPERQIKGFSNGRGGGKYINRIWEAPSNFHCHDLDARSRLWVKLDEELNLSDKGLLDILGL